MKKVIFKSLSLISYKSAKARKIDFNKKITVITSKDPEDRNTVGKSCILKSLYYALGADIKFASSWKDEKVVTSVTMSIDGNEYTIVRDGKTYSIYNQSKILLLNTTHVTSELSPFLAKLFNFPVLLETKQYINNIATMVPATPMHQYLPFYIDQDTGHVQVFKSFLNETQFKDGPKIALEFFIGLKPKNYWKNVLTSTEDKIEKAEIQEKQKLLQKLNEELIEKSNITVQLPECDAETFKIQLEKLSQEAFTLKEKQSGIQQNVFMLDKELSALDKEKAIIQNAMTSKEGDLDLLLSQSDLECPTCGTVHENNFISRFELSNKIAELQALKHEVDKEIQKNRYEREKLGKDIQLILGQIKSIEKSKTENETLLSFIELEASTKIKKWYFDTDKCYKKKIAELEVAITETASNNKSLINRTTSKELKDKFKTNISHFLKELNLQTATAEKIYNKGFLKVNDSVSSPQNMVQF